MAMNILWHQKSSWNEDLKNPGFAVQRTGSSKQMSSAAGGRNTEVPYPIIEGRM